MPAAVRARRVLAIMVLTPRSQHQPSCTAPCSETRSASAVGSGDSPADEHTRDPDPTMSFAVQRLRSSDTGPLKELLKAFADAFGQEDEYQGAVPEDGYLERLLSKDDAIVLVARKEARVVGGLVAYVLEKFERKRSEIYIYDLAVAAEHRRQGIAT